MLILTRSTVFRIPQFYTLRLDPAWQTPYCLRLAKAGVLPDRVDS
jgi:hypothetical protein